jgi:hypothetical protein
MSILDGKSKIKVEMTGADGIRRKDWVEHDAKLYNGKYIIDPSAVFMSMETGFLGRGGNSVPTIAFRANSIYPIAHRGKETNPDPAMFGENVAKAAHSIAILRETGQEQFEQIVKILLCIAILVAGAGTYFGYNEGKKLDQLSTTLDSVVAKLDAQQSQVSNQTQGSNGMIFDPATGTYHSASGG